MCWRQSLNLSKEIVQSQTFPFFLSSKNTISRLNRIHYRLTILPSSSILVFQSESQSVHHLKKLTYPGLLPNKSLILQFNFHTQTLLTKFLQQNILASVLAYRKKKVSKIYSSILQNPLNYLLKIVFISHFQPPIKAVFKLSSPILQLRDLLHVSPPEKTLLLNLFSFKHLQPPYLNSFHNPPFFKLKHQIDFSNKTKLNSLININDAKV